MGKWTPLLGSMLIRPTKRACFKVDCNLPCSVQLRNLGGLEKENGCIGRARPLVIAEWSRGCNLELVVWIGDLGDLNPKKSLGIPSSTKPPALLSTNLLVCHRQVTESAFGHWAPNHQFGARGVKPESRGTPNHVRFDSRRHWALHPSHLVADEISSRSKPESHWVGPLQVIPLEADEA